MTEPWKVSLHGGHSGEFCKHGTDNLRGMLESAVRYGFKTYGVSAHSPRQEPRFLYHDEIDAGYKPENLEQDFDRYVRACSRFIEEYEGRLEVLKGAEIEIVPEESFVQFHTELRNRYKLDYVVGSVHWVDELPIDTNQDAFDLAVAGRGGLEPFLIRYYQLVESMAGDLKPEVIGHIDLPRIFAEGAAELDCSKVRKAATTALETIKNYGCILDLNVSALSRGLSTPYPAPWIVQLASDIGVEFCFGDDSHSADQVGTDIVAGRAYLIEHGVKTITNLTRSERGLTKEIIPLGK